MKRICSRCGCEVLKETDSQLKKEYPYYCPECDENMYEFETEVVKENLTLKQYAGRCQGIFHTHSRKLDIMFDGNVFLTIVSKSLECQDFDDWVGNDKYDFNINEEVGQTPVTLCVYPVINCSTEYSIYERVSLKQIPD